MPKKLPAFVNVDALGRLRDRAGTELEPEVKRSFLDQLMLESPKHHDPDSLGEWRERVDPQDAERWGDGLEAAWCDAGAPAKHKWALFALTFFGSSERIAEREDAWARTERSPNASSSGSENIRGGMKYPARSTYPMPASPSIRAPNAMSV